MRFLIVAAGHRQPAWVSTAFAEYAKRMPREARVELTEIRPEPRNDAGSEIAVARLLEREAVRFAAAIPRGTAIIALDEAGEALTTRALASQNGTVALRRARRGFPDRQRGRPRRDT